MARIRTIKPEFWTSEQVMDCKPVTRLLFIGLWNFVDDYGRAPVAPRTIKAQVMPGDEFSGADIQDMLNELNSHGLILFYSADGKEYFEITGWAKHQKIDNPSKYKVCPAPFSEQSQFVAIPSEESPTIGLEGKGRERKVREKKVAAPKDAEPKTPRSKPKVTIPDDFVLSPAVRQYAGSLGFSESEILREGQRFARHAKQNDRRCANWDAAAHNWFDKAAEFAGKSPLSAQTDVDDGMIEVLDEEQLAAWDQYAKSRGAKSFPRNRRGGWRFPSKWPPGYEPQGTIESIPVPRLRTV